MRKILLFLLLVSISFSTFGQSFIRLERTWTIEGNSSYSFDGSFIVNDSNQEVVGIDTIPEMQVYSEGENIRLKYDGSEPFLKAIAIVRVNYSTNITQDTGTPNIQLNTTNLTAYNPFISSTAKNISEKSSLQTILNLVDFVNHHIAYNQTYFGKVLSAQDAFSVRQGVCVEYSHLLIGMARSLGYKTRYVSGYANGGIWQPHAWVEIEIPGYGYLPTDPTFYQIGILDNSHVAVGKGDDQESVYDRVESAGRISMNVSDNAEFINQTTDRKGLELSYSFNNPMLTIYPENKNNNFVYSTYSFSLPEEFGIQEREVVLLKPLERQAVSYNIVSGLAPGNEYRIPFVASLGDSRISEEIVVELQEETKQEEPSACIPTLIILSLINLYIFLQ